MNTEIFPLAKWWKELDSETIQCQLCPRHCKLKEGQEGYCSSRKNLCHSMRLVQFGKTSGLCVDPIEKKPLYHFFPGSEVLSFGTHGCNLACSFCQNWRLSKARNVKGQFTETTPIEIVQTAKKSNCKSVAFTYNEPIIFSEFAIEVAEICREENMKAVAVTNGYISSLARKDFFSILDAANVDLKGFTEEFYSRYCGGKLKPVLETLEFLVSQTSVWLEITTLLIPGLNDSAKEIEDLSSWIVKNLSSEIPIHFTAFHPDFQMRDQSPTSLDILKEARDRALQKGLKFVYIGNLPHEEGSTTYCPQCQTSLIRRRGYQVQKDQITSQGKCSHCGNSIPGRFV